MTDNHYSADFAEAAQAVFDSLDPARQRRTEILGRMHARYVGTPRDAELDMAFDGLIDNVAAALFGKAAKRRAIFIVGESGSGKSTAVEKHIAKRPQFAPRVTSDGRHMRTLVAFEAPKPLTLKGLAAKGLAALNYPVVLKNITEHEIFELWKRQLRDNGVLYLWIDEMQHVLRGNTSKEIQNVADVIKSLVQIDEWPLHLILSGVPALAQFVHLAGDTDRQLKERSSLVELRPLSIPGDTGRVRKIINKVVTEHASLEVDDLTSDEFIHRVVHAGNGAFGSVIQLIRGACEYALRKGSETVGQNHFAAVYALASGCRPAQNVFSSDQWESIVPDNSLSELLARVSKLESAGVDHAKAVKKKVK